MKIHRIGALCSLGFLSNLALGFSFPTLDSDPSALALSDPFHHQYAAEYDFDGIVALNNCSGSLIRFEESEDTDDALILTNGHCVGMIPPGTFYYNKKSSRSFRILDEGGSTLGRVKATRLVYATMTSTDIGIYQLDRNYNDIYAEFGASPLTLSSSNPEIGDEIEVISGYWQRGYSCEVEEFVHTLKEAKYIMHGSIRYSRPGCEVIGGTSGSPVIALGSRTQVAINNTGNESGHKCTMNNPCEVDEDGELTYQKGYTYAQQTVGIYSCLTDELSFDLSTEGCTLPKE